MKAPSLVAPRQQQKNHVVCEQEICNEWSRNVLGARKEELGDGCNLPDSLPANPRLPG